jgi:hypothetical protein
MDLLCETWIGRDGVHGFDCYDEICCYMLERSETVEKKIKAQAGEHKVNFKYGPPERADDITRRSGGGPS